MRTPLHLFLPKDVQPPYRTVVFYPGSLAFANPGPSDKMFTAFPGPEDFVIKSGLALAFPIYDGSYERWRANPALAAAELARYNLMRAAHRRQDLGRTIDYLRTRQDVQHDRLVYFGFSLGAGAALFQLALEDRFKTAILFSGGVGGARP